MRKYATTIILFLSMSLCELHTFWPMGGHNERWILQYDMSTTLRWNVKYALNELWPLLVFIAWLLYIPNKINYTTVLACLMWVFLDLVMYFYNYKTAGYWKVYYWIVPIWFIAYLWKGKKQEKVYKTLHPN
jgi:hypothetical protein